MPIPPWGAKPGTSGGGSVSSVSNSDGTLTISPTTGSVVASIATNTALPGSPTTTTQSASDNSTKIATTAYVTTGISNAISGVNPAIAVQAATTSASNTSGFTYNNGVSGVGATLTQNSAAVYTVDGFTFSATTQRLLVKNDTQTTGGASAGAFNGIYLCTTVGTSLIPAVFTRALDYDTPSDINNTGAIPVVNGTVNADTSWLLTSSVATVGTSALTYTQFSLNPTTIALNTGTLAQFASTTSLQLAGVISDETGTGALVFASNPVLAAPSFSSIVNSGTLTLPTSTDTLMGRATTDTVTGKSIDATTNTVTNIANANLTTTAGDIGGPSTSWSPTITGFSAAPASGIYQYVRVGKLVTIFITQPNNGTSNATTFTISLPFTALTLTSMQWVAPVAQVVDSGTVSGPGVAVISSAGTTVNFLKTGAGGAFTGSGNKRIPAFSMTYETA